MKYKANLTLLININKRYIIAYNQEQENMSNGIDILTFRRNLSKKWKVVIILLQKQN